MAVRPLRWMWSIWAVMAAGSSSRRVSRAPADTVGFTTTSPGGTVGTGSPGATKVVGITGTPAAATPAR
jgi:hypothetical protein